MAVHKINDFQYIRSDLSEKENVTVFEKSPIGISWKYMNQKYRRDNIVDRLYGDVDNDRSLIAIVDGPSSEGDRNKAIIIDAANNQIFDVKQLFREQCYVKRILPPSVDVSFAYFSGVYYNRKIDQMFYFFIHINGVDFRFPFNIETGEIGRLIESR